MSVEADRLIARLQKILAEDGWEPGSVAMNKLDALAAALEARAAQAEVNEITAKMARDIADERREAAEAQRDTLAKAINEALLRAGIGPGAAGILRAALAGVAPPEAQGT